MCGIHWKATIVMMPTLSSLVATSVVATVRKFIHCHHTKRILLSTYFCHRVQWLTVISRNDATTRETSWAILNNLVRYTQDKKKKKHAQLCSEHNSCWWSSTIMCKEVCRIIYGTVTKNGWWKSSVAESGIFPEELGQFHGCHKKGLESSEGT